MEIKLNIGFNYILLPVSVLIGLILAVGVRSMAEDSELDVGPRTLPYRGILDFNGSPLNGPVDLKFTLTNDASGENTTCWFEEEHDNVIAHAGRFSVNIGSVAGALPGCTFNSNSMSILVAVRNADSSGDYIALAGVQRINPAPFSYWSAEGADFKNDGDLTVDGNISNPSGSVTIDDSLQVNSGLNVQGNINNSTGNVVVSDNLNVTGALTARAGSSASDGITWPDNAFGGSGDDAWIRYYRDGSGENTALQIGIGNDPNDNIEFY
ncbi:MAG: hypothetical protein AAFS10_26260 [Myxococcota bacterium]